MRTLKLTGTECKEIQDQISNLDNSLISEYTDILSYINQIDSESKRLDLYSQIGKVPTVLIYQSALSIIEKELDEVLKVA